MVRGMHSGLINNQTTKIIDVTVARDRTFCHHTAEVDAKRKYRLKIMRAPSSTTFGHSNKLPYTSSFSGRCSDLTCTHKGSHQRTQDAALRIATGWVISTPTFTQRLRCSLLNFIINNWIHSKEIFIVLCFSSIKIFNKLRVRGLQFFLAYSVEEHPCNHLNHHIPTKKSLRPPFRHPPPPRLFPENLEQLPSNSELSAGSTSHQPHFLGLTEFIPCAWDENTTLQSCQMSTDSAQTLTLLVGGVRALQGL